MQKQKWIGIILVVVFIVSLTQLISRHFLQSQNSESLKVFWFIPDGLRADPDVFTIFKWAEEGHLPHLQKMLRSGSYGYSIPVFPGHTPSNFATLFTGEMPSQHGVTDGPIRPLGYPLQYVTRSGFSSVAKKKNPLWFTLEEKNITSTLISIPGSTPPETSKGNIVKGRWSNWGVDFTSMVFQSEDDEFIKNIGYNERNFGFGKRLSSFSKAKDPEEWASAPESYSPPREIYLDNWGFAVYGLIVDSTNNHRIDYDCVLFSTDRKELLAKVCEGGWSDWLPAELNYKLQKVYQDNHPQRPNWEQTLSEIVFSSFIRIHVIRLKEKDFFRIRFLYDGLNNSLTSPQELSSELHQHVGPMVDFVDDFPGQLVYFDEDKKTFLDEMNMSFEWHKKALEFFWLKKQQNIIIQNIYSPNQMLTSRWWMRYMDPQSSSYGTASDEEKRDAHLEVLAMYKKIDDMLGVALANKTSSTYVVFSSDHGVAPLNTAVRLNTLFAKKGWLNYRYDAQEKKFVINWTKSRVIFLQTNHVYINPKGLAGVSEALSGADYLQLRKNVQNTLRNLKTDSGEYVFEAVHTRDEAARALELSTETIGDLVLVSHLGFLPTEDISRTESVFEASRTSGYKQSLNPKINKALWTPFVVVGPGIKKNHFIEKPIDHVDQYRFIMNILGQKVSSRSQRDLLTELAQ